jgi:hypothetical protein
MLKKSFIRHLLVPLLAPALLVSLYLTPKHIFGCANRGYMALAVVFISLVAALTTAARCLSRKRQGNEEEANWWLLSTVILLSPLFLLAGPFG